MKKKCKTCGQINEAMDVICGMCGNDLSNPDNYEEIETFQSTQPSENSSNYSDNRSESTTGSYANTDVQDETYAEMELPSGVRRRRNQFGIGKVKSGKRVWSLGISKLIAFCLVVALPASSYTAYHLATGLTWKDLVLNMAKGTPVEDIINQAIVVQNEENSLKPEDTTNSKEKTKNNKKNNKKKNKKKKNTKKKNNIYVLKNSNKKYISKSALKKLSTKKLAIARNEIYARKGRKFTTKQWKQYFAKKKWYKPKYSAKYFDKHSNKLLNKYEKENIRRIKAIEKKRNKKK